MKLTIAAILLSATSFLSAKTVYTSKVVTGNWSTSSSWNISGSGTPVVYIINAGHTITLNQDASVKVDSLFINGNLVFGNGKKIEFRNNGAIIVNFGGSISGGNASSAFDWDNNSISIAGPFNGSNNITGGRFATVNTTVAANGVPAGSFQLLPVPLPVELSSISLENYGDNYFLGWTAVDMEAGTRFEVAVSSNGADWTVTDEKTVGAESPSISLSSNLGKPAKSFMVRLTLIDLQNNRKVLSTKYQRVDAENSEAISIFPTLVGGNNGNTIKINCPEAGTYTLEITSLNGQPVFSKSVTTWSDAEMVYLSSQELNTGNGYYILTVKGNSGSKTSARILINE